MSNTSSRQILPSVINHRFQRLLPSLIGNSIDLQTTDATEGPVHLMTTPRRVSAVVRKACNWGSMILIRCPNTYLYQPTARAMKTAAIMLPTIPTMRFTVF
jgi:hypothetical protein